MTSTSFNIGLNENTRISSRVLRPPGGGHTDIFGDEPEPQPQTPRRGGPPPSTGVASSIGDSVAAPKPANGQAAEPPAPAPAPALTQNGQNGQTTPQEPTPAPLPGPEPKKSSPTLPEPVSQPKAEAPKRVRVPPGGFSSGLW